MTGITKQISNPIRNSHRNRKKTWRDYENKKARIENIGLTPEQYKLVVTVIAESLGLC